MKDIFNKLQFLDISEQKLKDNQKSCTDKERYKIS